MFRKCLLSLVIAMSVAVMPTPALATDIAELLKEAQRLDAPQEVVKEAIAKDWTIEQFRQAVTGGVRIEGPSDVDAGTPVLLRVVGLERVAVPKLNWQIYPKPPEGSMVQLMYDAKDGVVLFFWSKAPGKYLVICDVNTVDENSLLTHELAYGKPEPGPDPGPDPEPDPGPLPDPSEMWGIAIVESGDMTPAQASVLASPDVRATFADGKFRWVDPDAADASGKTPPGLASWIARGQKNGLPAFFLVGVDGKLHWEGKLPATSTDLIALFKKYTKPASAPVVKPVAVFVPAQAVVKPPLTPAAADCPTGTCPTVAAPVYTRRGLFGGGR